MTWRVCAAGRLSAAEHWQLDASEGRPAWGHAGLPHCPGQHRPSTALQQDQHAPEPSNGPGGCRAVYGTACAPRHSHHVHCPSQVAHEACGRSAPFQFVSAEAGVSKWCPLNDRACAQRSGDDFRDQMGMLAHACLASVPNLSHASPRCSTTQSTSSIPSGSHAIFGHMSVLSKHGVLRQGRQ